jgi:hypothetical protein
VNARDYLGLEWSQVDGSFEWTQELQVSKWTPHFDSPANGIAEFTYADVTWKGTAKVTCKCSETGETKDASGALTAEVKAESDETLYFPTIPTGPIGVPTSLGDAIASTIEESLIDALLDALPPGITDEGNSAGDIVNAVQDSKPSDGDSSILWDNKSNPCQELNSK